MRQTIHLNLETDDDSRGTYNTKSQIKFKTSMLKSNLWDYSDGCILVKGIRKVPNTSAADEDANSAGKKVAFKNCAPFTDCISEINNTKIENSEGLDVAMPVHNLIEYSDIYWKTSAKLWQYCKDIPSANNAAIIDFNKANVANSFNFKEKP